MPRIIQCSESDFRVLSKQLMDSPEGAGEYCPPKEEIKKLMDVEPPYDLAYYIKFLLWVVITGTDTRDNLENRSYLSRVIAEKIKVIQDEKQV